MNKEIKKKWIKALRSGRYKQVQTCLENDKGNCCLGVLCRVLRLPHTEFDGQRIHFGPKGSAFNSYDNIWTSSYVPPRTREEIGLSDDAQQKLVGLNDTKHYSFSQIADWIETHL